MTKEEFLKDIVPYKEWQKKHETYVNTALEGLREWFDVDRFMKDYARCLDMEYGDGKHIVTTILADAYEDNNYSLGELENYLSRMFNTPCEAIVEYRTQKFWDDIKEV